MAGGGAHPDRTARPRYFRVLGPVDAQKLPSSMTLLARRPLCSMFRDVPAQYFAGQEQPEVADRQCPHQVAAPPLWGCDLWRSDALSLIHISEPTRLGMISYAV